MPHFNAAPDPLTTKDLDRFCEIVSDELSDSADEAMDIAMFYATKKDKTLTPAEASALGAAVVLRSLARAYERGRASMRV
jgi:hypothetical protein